MKRLLRDLLVVAILGVVSVGTFGQKKNEDKRPPKEPVKVITNDRKDKPPQNNDKPKRDPKKKP